MRVLFRHLTLTLAAAAGCSATRDPCVGTCVEDLRNRPADFAWAFSDLGVADGEVVDALSPPDLTPIAPTRKWVLQQSGAKVVLSGVWGSGPKDVYAVGGGAKTGTILHSTNAGKTWDAQKGVEAYGLDRVWGSGAGHVYVSGSAVIWHTTNSGKLWVEEQIPMRGSWERISGSGSDVFAVGSAGSVVYGSTVGGPWSSIHGQLGVTFYGLLVLPGPRVYACGTNGWIERSDDVGKSWKKLNTGTDAGFTAMWSAGSDELYAIASRPTTILHSLDGGMTFAVQNPGTKADLWDIWGSGPDDVWAVGGEATVLHTTDHGKTWKPEVVPFPAPKDIWAIWGSSPTDIYLVGGRGTIVHLE